LARLDKLCNFNKNNKPDQESIRPLKAYSRIFSTYVTLEKNTTKEVF
jgi:hypothetical protein